LTPRQGCKQSIIDSQNMTNEKMLSLEKLVEALGKPRERVKRYLDV